jgi:hypothetical protein
MPHDTPWDALMRYLNWSASRCLEVGKTHGRRTAERTGPYLFYLTVVAELVEDYLRAGWMIVLPSRAHPSAIRTSTIMRAVSVSREDRGDVPKLDTWGIPPPVEKPRTLRRGRGANYGGIDGTRGAPQAVRLRRVVSVRKFLFGGVWLERAPLFDHLLAEGVPGTPRAKSNRGQFGTVEPASLNLRQIGVTLRAGQVGVSPSAPKRRPKPTRSCMHQR